MGDNRIHITDMSASEVGADVVSSEPEKQHRKWRLPKWSRLSYARRVTLAFAMISAMTAFLAVIILSAVWENHFTTYTRTNMETVATNVALNIGKAYEKNGTWDDVTVQSASLYSSMYPTIGLLVVDRHNTVHFDSKDALGLTDEATAKQYDPSDDAAIAAISAWGTPIGWVRVWVYGSDTLLSQSDLEFRENSYQAMTLASILAILVACVAGYVFARKLVDPINRMTQTADAIKEGDLSARTGLTGEDEIARLGETLDAMAESVQEEREHERRLTTDVAHELRTPLMALRSTVEAMIDGVFEPDEERLETVNNEVQRLSRMVDAILKLSRLENRSTPLKLEVINATEVVEQIVQTHEMFVTDSGLKMTFAGDKNVMIKGDADMIRQATANLISNAVRYTPEGGEIHVSVHKGEIMGSITVEDTGIGLTPEEAKQVFNRFWRSDEGRSRESGGLGIGLAVVKEIVDQHGGWVQVEGQKNQGARFTIHIPLYNKNAELQKQREEQRKAKQKEKERARQQQRQQQKEKQRARQKSKEQTGKHKPLS